MELLEEKFPQIIVLLFVLKVPLVKEICLVLPNVKLSFNEKVPPIPLKLIGKSNVLPFDVIVDVPAVAEKDNVFVPDPTVIPLEIVNEPYRVRVDVLFHVPDNPVKFKALYALAELFWKISVPALTLILIEFDSDKVEDILIVLVPVAPE